MITPSELRQWMQKHGIKIRKNMGELSTYDIKFSEVSEFKKYYKRRKAQGYLTIYFKEKNKWRSYRPLKTNTNEHVGWYSYNQTGYGRMQIVDDLCSVTDWKMEMVVERLMKNRIDLGGVTMSEMYLDNIEDLEKYHTYNLKRMENNQDVLQDEGLLKVVDEIVKTQKKMEELDRVCNGLKHKVIDTIKRKSQINLDYEE